MRRAVFSGSESNVALERDRADEGGDGVLVAGRRSISGRETGERATNR